MDPDQPSPLVLAACGILGFLAVGVQVAKGALAVARWQARNQRTDRLACR